MPSDASFMDDLRLFLEGVCCDLCRFEHAGDGLLAAESVGIRQEEALGTDAFADIVVRPPDGQPYFVEVDYGYSDQRLQDSIRRKFGTDKEDVIGANRVILVIDTNGREDWAGTLNRLRETMRPGLTLEVWDEAHLRGLLATRFGVDVTSFEREADLLALRAAIDEAKCRHAFGTAPGPVETSLMWHLSFWKLQSLRESAPRAAPDQLLSPGLYGNVAVIFADLSGFTGFVRDTRDEAIVRRMLTAFAQKARYQVISSGGMIYQFLGDAVIAFFGLPHREPDDFQRALDCARSLLDIGQSVATEWQRLIDRVQPKLGMHVGMSAGDIQILGLQPFSCTQLGAVGDVINLAARLNGTADTGEIVASNVYYQHLPQHEKARFIELEPVEAKNFGRVRAWKSAPA